MIKDLPKYKDLRGSIRRKGRYPVVGTSVKDTIVIHHSMTSHKAKGSTPQAFANYHIDSNKWPGIAYPFVISPDGTINQCDDLDRRTYHAGNTNTRSIGICVIGDFRKEGAKEKPTEAQMMSLYLLVKELQATLPKLKIIKGHQECPGYSWKNCPGDTWDYKSVVNGSFIKTVEKPKEEIKPDQKYRLLTGTYGTESAAKNADASIKKNKIASYTEIKKDGNFFRVQTGTYTSKSHADVASAKIKQLKIALYVNILEA